MSISLTRDELCAVVGGRVVVPEGGRAVMRGVEFDSRMIKGGELFVALKGATSHGHQFAEEVLARGAAAVLMEDEALAHSLSAPERCVVVEDTLRAFHLLAGWWRGRFKAPVLAITGSVGKTTTKELLAQLLLARGVGTYSLKSFNNHVGVPYTLCRFDPSHAWGVIEMGMNHSGEIATLSALARPDVGVITAIAPAHIEFFRDIDAIGDAKCELVQGIGEEGVLVANQDDAVLIRALGRAAPQCKVRYFGTGAEAECRLRSVQGRGLDGVSIEWELGGERRMSELALLGIHNGINAAAAILAARAAFPDLTADEISEGLRRFRAPLMRLQRITLGDGRVVVDDSYNANPASMRAMLDIVRDLRTQGRRVGVILGEMRELGERAATLHREIGSVVGEVQPDFLVTVGELAKEYCAPGVEHYHAESPEQAGHVAGKRRSDILFVKASRGIGLDRAVKALVATYGEGLPSLVTPSPSKSPTAADE